MSVLFLGLLLSSVLLPRHAFSGVQGLQRIERLAAEGRWGAVLESVDLNSWTDRVDANEVDAFCNAAFRVNNFASLESPPREWSSRLKDYVLAICDLLPGRLASSGDRFLSLLEFPDFRGRALVGLARIAVIEGRSRVLAHLVGQMNDLLLMSDSIDRDQFNYFRLYLLYLDGRYEDLRLETLQLTDSDLRAIRYPGFVALPFLMRGEYEWVEGYLDLISEYYGRNAYYPISVRAQYVMYRHGEEAEVAYWKSIRDSDLERLELDFELARLYLGRGSEEEKRDRARQLISIVTSRPVAFADLVHLLVYAERYAAAELASSVKSRLEGMRASSVYSSDVQAAEAFALYREGRGHEALFLLRRVFLESPYHYESLLALHEVAQSMGDKLCKRDALLRLYELQPTDVMLAAELALADLDTAGECCVARRFLDRISNDSMSALEPESRARLLGAKREGASSCSVSCSRNPPVKIKGCGVLVGS